MSRKSTKELAATLPPKAPNTEQHKAVLSTPNPYQYKYQIYSLVPLDQEALARLEKDIDAGHPDDDVTGGNSALSKEAGRFAGKSLREVYDYHLEARDRDPTVHPLFFIVADNADWKENGVLVVHLDCGWRAGAKKGRDCVGVGRCGIDWADSWGVNIDIGNMDWMDLKEMEETDWGGDDPYGDEDGDDDAGDSEDEADDGKDKVARKLEEKLTIST